MKFLVELRSGLTQARLREVLSYNPVTGKWVWRVTNSVRKPAGSDAGEVKKSGYILIGVDGHRYRAHRLAYLYVTGTWPPDQMDHENLIRSDNRWSNLRIASNQDNQANKKRHRNNKSGVKGVYWNKQRQKWAAKINPDRKQVHLGFFDRIEDAGDAYATAAKAYFREFARAA